MNSINHLDILKRGVSEWNKWRVERTNIAPDLKGAVLKDASLAGADLRAVNLKGADLRGANLRGANLKAADLRAADLKGAILWSASLTGADLRETDLTGADLRGVNFRAANLMNAILIDTATNDYTDFRHATLTGARLWKDGEPVAEDWQAEVARTAEKYLIKLLVKIEYQESIAALELAALLSLLDEAAFEYEESFIVFLADKVGGSLADACMHGLLNERQQIVRLVKFEAGPPPIIEVVLVPMGFILLGRIVFKDIEDIWKKFAAGDAIKKVLISRSGQVAKDLERILTQKMGHNGILKRFELTVKPAGEKQGTIELTIREGTEKNTDQHDKLVAPVKA